ncbi:MAG TPA: hypothetical protein VN520_28835, partial [Streptomyces sp.]|uniref:hypothetical protein n=1 Tax=Streptomyces sp. TaxID=1931 RepID=UPI002BDE8C48|nr:hypothetical protein [Streptomyces sp.]
AVSGWAQAGHLPYTLDLPPSAGAPAAAAGPGETPAATGVPAGTAPRTEVPAGVEERIPYAAER